MRVDILTANEVQAISDRLAGDDLILWTIGTTTGLRISDILPITVGTIRGKRRLMIKEHKTGKRRRVYISQQLQAMISDYIDRHNMRNSDRLLPKSYTTYYRHIVDAAKDVTDKHIGTHTMRKSYATSRLRKGYNLYQLQQCLNHTHISDTIGYTIPNSYFGGRKHG